MRTHACALMYVLFACLPSLYAQQPSDHRNALEQEIVAKEKEVWELNVREDWDTYAKLLSDDLLIVYSTGYSDKTNVLKALLGMSEQHYSMEDVRVIPVGDAAGLIVYKVTQDWKERGRKMTAQYFVSSLWQKQDGKWLNRFWQETETALPDDLRAAEQKDVENQIVILEKRLWNGDAADVSKLEADDYETIKHAHRYQRADDEAAVKDVKFGLISMDDIQVRMLRTDVALMTYHATERGTFRGTEVPPSLYFASLWVKRDGEWKNVFLAENLPDVFTESYKPLASSKQNVAALSVGGDPNNSSPSSFGAKQQVLDLSKEWVAAEIKHDANTLRRILDDKFVASFGAEKPYDKEAFIKLIVTGDVDPTESQTLTDETVVIDQDTAVVVGTDTLRGTKKGAAYTLVARYTVTYIRRHGEWAALAEHLVELPQAK